MDAVTYPHAGVVRRLNEMFVAVKPPIADNADAKRLNAIWTPGILVLDGTETIHYRAYGYHPPEEFEQLLHIGHGMWELGSGRPREAARDFTRVLEDEHRTLLEPEAMYWLAVAQYKGGDKDAMGRTWNRLIDAYPETIWAKRAGFIRPQMAAA